MTIRLNILGETYDDNDVPCFFITGSLAFNRITRKYYKLSALMAYAQSIGYTFPCSEINLMPLSYGVYHRSIPLDPSGLPPAFCDPGPTPPIAERWITVSVDEVNGLIEFDGGPQPQDSILTVDYRFSGNQDRQVVGFVNQGFAPYALAFALANSVFVGGAATQYGNSVQIKPNSGTLAALSASIVAN